MPFCGHNKKIYSNIYMKFHEFLKKYSNLSNDFIDDFYNIYDYNESNNNEFIINLEL